MLNKKIKWSQHKEFS